MTKPKKPAPVFTSTTDAAVAEHGRDYVRGYNQAIRDMAWTCGDCGNTYDSQVDECPNELLDEIHAWETRNPK